MVVRDWPSRTLECGRARAWSCSRWGGSGAHWAGGSSRVAAVQNDVERLDVEEGERVE